MTDETRFDRLLTATLRADGPEHAPAGLLEASLGAARGVRQRRRRFAALDRAAWPAVPGMVAHPGTAALARAAALALLVLALLATTLIAGALVDRWSRPELVFGSANGGLWIARWDGSEPRRIANDGWYVEPRLSRDGQWIAARMVPYGPPVPPRADVPPPEHLVILRPDGTLVMDLPSANPAAYAWGAAGDAAGLLAAAFDEELVVIDPATRTTATVARGEPYGRTFAWSPIRAQLLWATGHAVNFRAIEGARIHAADVHADATGPRVVGVGTFELVLDRSRTLRGLEAMAVSPDGARIAFRARTEGWLRSELLIADIGHEIPTYLTAAPPDAPWAANHSGVRWTPNGDAIIAVIGGATGAPELPATPALVPVDGSAARAIELGSWEGYVGNDDPVTIDDHRAVLGSGRLSDERYPALAAWSIPTFDLWVVNADGTEPRRVASDTVGGDVR